MAQQLTPEHVRFLMDNGLRRVSWRDPSLRHQILMLPTPGGRLALTCNCKRFRGDGRSLGNSSHEPIEVRALWEPGEAAARWEQHVAEAEAAAADG
jgi:hypothetical protein